MTLRCFQEKYATLSGNAGAFAMRAGKQESSTSMNASSFPKPVSKVTCHSWLAPSLDRQTADETPSPALVVADLLHLECGFKEVVHRRNFVNQRCISIMPEDGLGGS